MVLQALVHLPAWYALGGTGSSREGEEGREGKETPGLQETAEPQMPHCRETHRNTSEVPMFTEPEPGKAGTDPRVMTLGWVLCLCYTVQLLLWRRQED